MLSSFPIASLLVAALASTVLTVFVSKDGTQYCTSLHHKCNKCIVGCKPSDDPNYQNCVLKVCKGRNRYCTIYQAQSKNAAACMKSLPAGSSVAGCQAALPECY